MDHTGTRGAPEVTTTGVQQHTHQLDISDQEYSDSNQKQQVQAEQVNNHQPKHDAALNSTAAGHTGHCEIERQVGRKAEKQSCADEPRTVFTPPVSLGFEPGMVTDEVRDWCAPTEETKKQGQSEKPGIIVIQSSNSAWPNTYNTATGSSPDTRNTTAKGGIYDSPDHKG